MHKEVNERHALRTINAQANLALPGPSKVKAIVKQKLDGRYVTLGRRVEQLDRDFKVFKDDRGNEDNEVIIISDDEDTEVEGLKLFVENKQKNFLGETRTAVTPAVKNLEPSRVKNIKRSLKRPHSRELQGISPLSKNQKKEGEERVRRRLHFNEPLQERLMTPDFWKRSYMECMYRYYASDMFENLLAAEEKRIAPTISSVMRSCVINWLMKINSLVGNPTIVQTAIWYLDSVLSVGLVRVNKLQVIGAACYWIARKLHGPGLSASSLAKCSNQAFSAEILMAAEKVVLDKLKFPSQPVIPQEYITYLSWWCDQEHPGEIEVAATFLCMAGLMVDKSLCTEVPSVVGAAAVRNALLLLRKKDLMVHLQMCPVFRAIEKKADNLSHTCSILRHAVLVVASPAYEYRTPLDHYGKPPHFIAQRIINEALS